MIVHDHYELGQDASNIPSVTVLDPTSSSVTASKKYYFFGDRYVPLKLQVSNATQYNAFQLIVRHQEPSGALKSAGADLSLQPGESTTISFDLYVDAVPTTLSITVWINALYKANQPVSDPANAVSLSISVQD